jgi:hypothetical protein
MSSRNMCLLPRATLHSDSEQVQCVNKRLQLIMQNLTDYKQNNNKVRFL